MSSLSALPSSRRTVNFDLESLAPSENSAPASSLPDLVLPPAAQTPPGANPRPASPGPAANPIPAPPPPDRNVHFCKRHEQSFRLAIYGCAVLAMAGGVMLALSVGAHHHREVIAGAVMMSVGVTAFAALNILTSVL